MVHKKRGNARARWMRIRAERAKLIEELMKDEDLVRELEDAFATGVVVQWGKA